MSDEDGTLGGIFDAALANWIILGELIVALAENGTLTREAVATILVRSERVTAQLPDGSPARPAHAMLLEHVQSRLALQPDIYARRLRPEM